MASGAGGAIKGNYLLIMSNYDIPLYFAIFDG